MSFSAQIREEIGHIYDSARHCALAECAACAVTTGGEGAAHKKFFTLLQKTFNIDAAVESIPQEVYEALHWDGKSGGAVSPLLLKNSCCKRAYLRGMYLSVGSMSDPEKGYHMEYVCTGEAQAEQLREVLAGFGVHAGRMQRKGRSVVYLKESEAIAEVLNIIGAHRALMEMENLRIVKELRSTANRRVNCDNANIQKMVGAAERQIEDIRYLQRHGGLESLPDALRDMAYVRLEYPDTPLRDLGGLLVPSVGKSGVNHRLRKLSELARERREENGDKE